MNLFISSQEKEAKNVRREKHEENKFKALIVNPSKLDFLILIRKFCYLHAYY